MRWLAWVGILTWTGCNGCPGTPGDTAPATRWVDRAFSVKVRARVDTALQARRRFDPLTAKVLTPDQLARLSDEMRLALGFDPTSEESLRDAGLDVDGQVAWGLEPDRLLVSIPAGRPNELFDLISEQLERRFGKPPQASDGIFRFDRSFGPDVVEAAALARHASVVLLGVGPGASELVKAARSLPEARSSTPELESDAPVRIVVTPDPRELRRAVDALPDPGRIDVDRLTDLAEDLGTLTLDGHFTERGAGMDGLWKLEGDLLERFGGLGVKGRAPPAVEAVNQAGPFLVLQAAMAPRRLYAALVPPGSPTARAVDQAREEGRLFIDPEPLFDDLSGHFGLAVGGGDLREVPFKALVGNPLAHLWTLFVAGKDSGADLELGKLQDRMKTSQQIDVQDVTIRDRAASRWVSKEGVHLVTGVELEDAVLLANEDAVLDRVLAELPDARMDPGLFHVELRFDELEAVLRTFPGARLPLVFRALWARGLDALTALEAATVRVDTSSMGLKFDARLTLDPAESSAP